MVKPDQKEERGGRMSFGKFFSTCWLIVPMGLWAASNETETSLASPGQVQVGGPSSGTPDPLISIMNTSNYANEFTGQPAFSIPLGSISNHGGISHAVNLQYYGGGLEHSNTRKAEFNPTSWVGEGFSLKAPYILAEAKGTLAVNDDGYKLSLDGNTQWELIPEAINSHTLYPKIRPNIQVSRSGHSLFDPWVVRMPDGSKYHFASSGANDACDAAKNALCLPIVGPLFSQLPKNEKAPVLWYLTSIESKDGAFRIFFEYEKITTGNADKAIYPKSIYAVNGNTPSSTVVSEIRFRHEPKNDVVDNSFRDPLAWFESNRLATVYFKNQGDTARTFYLKYQPGPGKTRLAQVREASGKHERRYYQCEYDPVNNWQVKKVIGPSGLAWEYGYTATPVDAVRQDIGIGPFTFGQIGFTGEYNGKYYVQVATEPNGFGTSSHLMLYEFEHRGSYWKLIRTYTGGVSFSMAPDGSYFALASVGANSSYKLRLFNPLAAGLEGVGTVNIDDPVTYPPGFNILDTTVWLQSEFPLMPPGTNAPNGGPQIFAFSDWLAIYKPGYGVVRFFQKDPANSWENACPEYGSGSKLDPYVLPPAINSGPGGLGFELIQPNQNNPCWAWTKMTQIGNLEVSDIRLLDVRQGDNFIAVILRNVGATSEIVNQRWTMGGAIRIFAHVAGQIKWVDPGNTISNGFDDFFPRNPNPLAKGFPTWGSRDQRWFSQQNPLSIDVSVHGDLVGLLVRRPIPDGNINTSNVCLHVFSVDLQQNIFRNVYTRAIAPDEHKVTYGTLDNKWSINDSHLFLGRNFLVHKRRRQGDVSPFFHIEAYHFNRVSGKTDMKLLSDINQETRFQTAVKIMGDYFFVETMNASESPKEKDLDLMPAFRQAVSGTNYPAAGPGRLYRLRPGTVSTPLAVEEIPINGLNQVTIHEDRFLAFNNTVGAKNFVYGRINELGNISGAINSSTTRSVLCPSGVIEFNRSTTASQLHFYDDFKGNLSPESISVVQQVKVSTKGSASLPGDGSEQTIQFNYMGATTHYNAKGRVPNFRNVKRILSGPSSEIVTEYITDFEGSELVGAAQTLHGLSAKVTARPGPVSGRQPGERETQDDYFVSELTNAPGGQALKKPAHAVRLRKRSDRSYFFNGQRTTETRHTSFEALNGLPRVTVVKNGSTYQVRAIRFEHEIAEINQQPVPVSTILVRQSADYLFQSPTDICSGAGEDPCAGIDSAWLSAASQRNRALSSQISTYNSDGEIQSVFSWRKKHDTTGLHSLDGTPAIPQNVSEASAGKWVKELEILTRAEVIPAMLSKHNGPAVTDRRGVKSTVFYGGLQGLPLAVAENAGKAVCSYLGAEEEETGAGFGAFGDWEATGSISNDMAHSGTRSVKVTGAFGPTINIHFKQDLEFWARKKGLLISGWMFIPGISSGIPTEDPLPAASIEFRTSALTLPTHVINLIPGAIPYNRWVKIERLVTWEEMESLGGGDPVLRIWFGKAETSPQNALPVYVDDLRIHPVDATMTSRSYDVRGRETAILNTANLPVYPEYDVWDDGIGAKDDRGKAYSASALKRSGEE